MAHGHVSTVFRVMYMPRAANTRVVVLNRKAMHVAILRMVTDKLKLGTISTVPVSAQLEPSS